MKFEKIEEQIKIGNNDINKVTYSSSFSNREFYENLEDFKLENIIQEEFLKLIKERKKDKTIALVLNVNIGNSRVQKYLGIWKRLEKEGIFFENKHAEKLKETCLSGIAFPNEEELSHLFKPYDWLIIMGNKKEIEKLYEKYSFNVDDFKMKSLSNGCTIVEYIDIGVDGKSLIFIEKL